MFVVFLWGRHMSLDFMRCPAFWIPPYMFKQRMLEGCSQPVLHQTLVVERGSSLSLHDRWDTDLKYPHLKYQAFTEFFCLFSSPSLFPEWRYNLITQYVISNTAKEILCIQAASWRCSLEQSSYHPFQVQLLQPRLGYSHGFGNSHSSGHQTARLRRQLLEQVPPFCLSMHCKGPHAASEQ